MSTGLDSFCLQSAGAKLFKDLSFRHHCTSKYMYIPIDTNLP